MTTVKPNCLMHWTVAVMPARAISIAIAQSRYCRHSARWFYLNNFTSVVEPTANICFHEQKSPILKKCITCTNLVLTGWMRYCNYCDVMAVYSLNSQNSQAVLLQPGNEPYSVSPIGILSRHDMNVTWRHHMWLIELYVFFLLFNSRADELSETTNRVDHILYAGGKYSNLTLTVVGPSKTVTT